MKRPRKQLLLKLGVFLLLGAIVNVTVAWAAVMFGATSIPPSTQIILSPSLDAKWERQVPSSWPSGPLLEGTYRTHLMSYSCMQSLPYVSMANALPHGTVCTLDICKVGWPMSSLLCQSRLERPLGAPKTWQWEYSFSPPEKHPYMPAWPGFAINTIFYAAILWLGWIAPGKIRRFVRFRQHRCPACGFIIAPGTCANGLCSECGAALPWMTKASA